MDLYYLIYTSVPARIMRDPDLQHLLKIAREANKQFEITGMLICLPESYVQLIEGPKPNIERLYENIQRDQRHMRVTILREGQSEHRFFPDWAMAYSKRGASSTKLDPLNLQDDKIFQLFDILEG